MCSGDDSSLACSDPSEGNNCAIDCKIVLPLELILVSRSSALGKLNCLLHLKSTFETTDPKYHPHLLEVSDLACSFLVSFHGHLTIFFKRRRQLAATNSPNDGTHCNTEWTEKQDNRRGVGSICARTNNGLSPKLVSSVQYSV